ncbi:DUF5683 domain-containing protein [Fibrobacterota bacterium]
MKIWVAFYPLLFSLASAQPDTSRNPVAQPDSINTSAAVQNKPVDPPDAGKHELKAVQTVTGAGSETEDRTVTGVFVPQVEQQQQARQEIVFPQDPRLSALLSVTFPGLGQLYQSNYLKSFLFAGTFLASSGVIAYYTNENRERSAEIIRFHDENNNLVELKRYPELEVGHSELNTTEKVVNVVAFVAVGISYFWSVIDAYRSAKAFNRKHFFSSPGKLGLESSFDAEHHRLALVYRF